MIVNSSPGCRHASSSSLDKCITCFRHNLPIYPLKEQIVHAINKSQFVIVEAETGSGKSTQIPQYLLESGYKGIICTQPRRIAAISLASRVAKEVNCQLGTTVGYKVRFDEAISDETILTYTSDGILLRELSSNKYAEGYSVVIIDEAHQRSAATDILMALLKKLSLESRSDLKIVITSATIDLNTFTHHFEGAVTISVPGKLFPVDVIYSPASNVLSIVYKIISANKPGDILIFLPGIKEIMETCDTLISMLPSSDTIVLPLYSDLPADEQSMIFVPTPAGYRKIICSTNVAETSLTIEGIVFVIDSGRVRQINYNTRSRIDVMAETDVSKQEADQRKGRAGRLQPGICYRSYSQDHYLQMQISPTPEISRCNFTPHLLYLKALGITDVTQLALIDPPPDELIAACERNLRDLEAVDEDACLTDIGRQIARLPIDPLLGRALVNAKRLKCLEAVLIIVSMMSTAHRVSRKGSINSKFIHQTGEHMTLYNVYIQWVKSNCDTEWCHANDINAIAMSQAAKIYQQLKQLLSHDSADEDSCDDDICMEENILQSFINKCGSNVAEKCMSKTGSHVKYMTNDSCEAVYLHSSHPLASNAPDVILFHKILRTNLTFMQYCSKIHKSHLNEIAIRKLTTLMSSNITLNSSLRPSWMAMKK